MKAQTTIPISNHAAKHQKCLAEFLLMVINILIKIMGATLQKNKLDTLANHHQSTGCSHFTPSKPLTKFHKVFVPFFTPLTLPNYNLRTAPFSSPHTMGATTQKNKLDALAKHHQSASCSHLTPSKPLQKFHKVFVPFFPPSTLPNSTGKHHLAQIAFWRQRGGFNQLIGAE